MWTNAEYFELMEIEVEFGDFTQSGEIYRAPVFLVKDGERTPIGDLRHRASSARELYDFEPTTSILSGEEGWALGFGTTSAAYRWLVWRCRERYTAWQASVENLKL